MSATTAVGHRPKSKQSKGPKSKRRAQRTNPGSNSVTTGQQNGTDNTKYHKQNAYYDGTGRLYECMSVGELNIRLRNLADHCLATHKGNLEQREKLLHEIKDIQKIVEQLMKELKDQIMSAIGRNAESAGLAEKKITQLEKERDGLQLELEHERNRLKSGSKVNDDLKEAFDEQKKAIEKQQQDELRRLQQELKNAKNQNDELTKQLNNARGQLLNKDQRLEQLTQEVRELQSANNGLEGQIKSLNKQLKAKDRQQRLSISNGDPELQSLVDTLRKQNEDLANQLARWKSEAKEKESTIQNLIATNQAFEDKLGKELKDQFEAFLDKASEAHDARRDTEELKKYYKEQLDRMHSLWQAASKEIRNIFDKNYNDLKERLENAYNEAKDRCDELERGNEELSARVQELIAQKLAETQKLAEAEKSAANDRNVIGDLRRKVDELNGELVGAQVKISQYRVIWNHYMMLEGKLKDEIGHLANGMDFFEDQMQVDPPMPKKRKLAIGSIGEYSGGHLPLELSEVPTPELLFFKHHLNLRKQRKSGNERNDSDIDNSRFLLVNNSRTAQITLLGKWHLVNDRGDKVPLPSNLALDPASSIGICMGSSKLDSHDILLSDYGTKNNEPFITFTKSTDRLYLEDTTGARIELFSPSLPKQDEIKEDDIDLNLDNQGGTIETAERIKNYIDLQEILRIGDKPHFVLVNVCPNPIILKGFKLRREKGRWEMAFPEIEMIVGHPLRFVFATEAEQEGDILIDPRDFGPIDKRDNLILEDRFGARHHLISNLPSPQRPGHKRQAEDKCLVM